MAPTPPFDLAALDQVAGAVPGLDIGIARGRLLGLAAAPAQADPAAALAALLPGLPEADAAAAQPLIEAARRVLLEGLEATAESAATRLAALRAELARRELDGFLVPMADEHQGEYIPPSAQRLAWLTGFTGSAGLAVVLAETAAIFVDGRYTLQVRDQVDTGLFTPRHMFEEPAGAWLAQQLQPGQRLGYDPWLHTRAGLASLQAAAKKAEATLVPVAGNPVDTVWKTRPPEPLSPLLVQPLALAGEAHEDKITRLAEGLRMDGLDGAVISAPDALAWLLNLRGGDLPNNPLGLGYALLDAGEPGSVQLFVKPAKVTPEVRAHLGNRVTIENLAALGPTLASLGAGGVHLRLDQATASDALATRIESAGGTVSLGSDPCALPRALKNPAELAGSRAAHERDGAALIAFLAWLDGAVAAGESLDELAVVAHLAAFRRRDPRYRGGSFDTIAGFGPNGAIVHYRASAASARRLADGGLLLLDSGGQYQDGTTDVTRTVAIGTPSPEHRDRYSRVLKGHLALGAARFPAGTSGSQLDALARLPLWLAGLDYDHGTGHGVGSFLCVHEGPQRISKQPNSIALQPGMIVSNEPGFYKTGAYGIRIENLVAVVTPRDIAGGERAMLGFETLTLVPYDRRLIEPTLLTAAERHLVDAYHGRIRATLAARLDPTARDWLERATAPL